MCYLQRLQIIDEEIQHSILQPAKNAISKMLGRKQAAGSRYISRHVWQMGIHRAHRQFFLQVHVFVPILYILLNSTEAPEPDALMTGLIRALQKPLRAIGSSLEGIAILLGPSLVEHDMSTASVSHLHIVDL